MNHLQVKQIKNLILDINGVLFDSGCDYAIEGSVEALDRLEKKYKYCLLTNECTTAKRLLAEKLNGFGFKSISAEKIISPSPVANDYIKSKNLIPRLHVWDGILEDFKDCLPNGRQPSCLVVGDPMSKTNRDFLDESLEMMINSPIKPEIISLGSGRYYKDAGRLRMDTGCYVAAFEFALGVTSINLGKPSKQAFEMALKTVGGTPSDTIMIGDDILSDVGGAQACGMMGALVKTGKYKVSDEQHPVVKADAVFDNLSKLADFLLNTE